jgi:hypothetical protein
VRVTATNGSAQAGRSIRGTWLRSSMFWLKSWMLFIRL